MRLYGSREERKARAIFAPANCGSTKCGRESLLSVGVEISLLKESIIHAQVEKIISCEANICLSLEPWLNKLHSKKVISCNSL